MHPIPSFVSPVLQRFLSRWPANAGSSRAPRKLLKADSAHTARGALGGRSASPIPVDPAPPRALLGLLHLVRGLSDLDWQ